MSFTLQDEVAKATFTTLNLISDGVIKDQSLPLPLLTNARGLAFLTVFKAGFFLSGRIGTGLVISKLEDGSWSAPSAIGTVGLGWGMQFGGELTDFIIVLNTEAALDSFCSTGQVSLGAEVGIAAGPTGRTAAGAVEAGAKGTFAPCYSYSHSQGLYVGLSLEGAIIVTRHDVNERFYGRTISVADLLGGVEAQPKAADPLYGAIKRVLAR